MFLVFAALTQQAIRGNLTVNFGLATLSNQGNVFTIPSLRHKFSLSMRNLISTRSFSPFINSFSHINARIKITDSRFTNYRSNAIYLAAEGEEMRFRDSTYEGETPFESSRTLEGLSLDIQNCFFKNFELTGNLDYMSDSCGSAIYLSKATNVNIYNTGFSNCKCNKEGGAIFIKETTCTVSIKECKFYVCSAAWGSAIFLYKDADVVIVQCLFENSIAADSSIYDTGNVIAYESKLTVNSSTFCGSTFSVSKPNNFGEITVLDSNALYTFDNCFEFGTSIDVADHHGIYNSRGELTDFKFGGLKADSSENYLYYITAELNAKAGEGDIGICRHIYQTPIPTPTLEATIAPTETTPAPTIAPTETTPAPTIAETMSPTISQTISPTISPTIEMTQEESNQLTQEQITLAWAIPVAIIVIIIIVVIIIFALKDRRSAERDKENDPDADLNAFPDV
jgi:hypothetical protein